MAHVILSGTVSPGTGVASHSLSRLMQAIKERSGLLDLQPGTLNVLMGTPYELRADFTFAARDWNHHEDVLLQHCRIFNREAVIIRTSTNHHGSSVLEIMAEVHLRSFYRLRDHDPVQVEVEAYHAS